MGRSAHRFLVATIIVLLLVPGLPTAWAGSQDDPEIGPPDESEDDESGDPGASTAWADIHRVWITRTETDLVFSTLVRSLGSDDLGASENASGRWNFAFNNSGSQWIVRAQWGDAGLEGQVVKDGTVQGGALAPVRVINASILRVAWANFDEFLEMNTTLTGLHAYTVGDYVTATIGQGTDCFGVQSADCAPDSGVGRDFPLFGPLALADLDLSVSPANATAEQGDRLSFGVQATNNANRTVNVSVAVSEPVGLDVRLVAPSGANATGPRSLNATLASGGSVRAAMEVNVTTDAAGGQNHTIRVEITPGGSSGVKSIRVPVFVLQPPEPPPPYRIRVTAEPASRTAHPGESVTYNVTVANEGRLPDAYEITLASDVDWDRLSEAMLALGPGEEAEVTLTGTVPEDADEGQTSHTVEVTSQGDENVTASTFVVTQVQFRQGLVESLDRTLQRAGLGGLVPTLALLVILVVLILYVVIPALRRRRILKVEADWEEPGEPGDEGEEPPEGGS